MQQKLFWNKDLGVYLWLWSNWKLISAYIPNANGDCVVIGITVSALRIGGKKIINIDKDYVVQKFWEIFCEQQKRFANSYWYKRVLCLLNDTKYLGN